MTLIGSPEDPQLTEEERELAEDLWRLKARIAAFEARHRWFSKHWLAEK